MLSLRHITGATESHLIDIESQRLEEQTARAYMKLKQAALGNGVDIRIASGFRSLDRQLSIWNRKWRGELSLRDKNGEIIDVNALNDIEKLWAILHWSALPGGSRHHWGSDLDVYDPRPFDADKSLKLELVPGEYVNESGPCYELWQWLTQHAHEYGFFFPYARYQGGVAQEPWHLSYRPISSQCHKLLSLEVLEGTISALDLEGKPCILDNLPTIKKHYIDTITEDEGWTNIWCGY